MITEKLRELLKESVSRNWGDGLLLSGGLDTAILAHLSYPKPKAITVAFRESEAPDVPYASLVAQFFGLEHYIYFFSRDELFNAIREVIRVMRSFDPMEIRNSSAIYIALKRAKEEGIRSVMTGDGCDELFAGYSFFFQMEKKRLEQELRKMWQGMRFSSVYLAQDLGMEAKLPYLDPSFMNFAMGIDVELKVKRDKDRVWGKWILRQSFEGLLPEEIIWRVKTPIETGTGTSILTSLLSSISDEEFEKAKEDIRQSDGVILRDKEQLFYFQIFRSLFGVLRRDDSGCPYCGFPVKGKYCPTCGAYPIGK